MFEFLHRGLAEVDLVLGYRKGAIAHSIYGKDVDRALQIISTSETDITTGHLGYLGYALIMALEARNEATANTLLDQGAPVRYAYRETSFCGKSVKTPLNTGITCGASEVTIRRLLTGLSDESKNNLCLIYKNSSSNGCWNVTRGYVISVMEEALTVSKKVKRLNIAEVISDTINHQPSQMPALI